MTQPGLEQQQQNHEENQKEPTTEGRKRKLEDTIELAKQKAQEIASRLIGDVDSKRVRLGSEDNTSSEQPPAPENSSRAAYPLSVPSVPQSSQYLGVQSKKITIPNDKVGVVIGRGGETIKYIQLQSGAKIQISRDQESNPHCLTRDVDLTGTSEQINRAEQLINDVIAEADAGGSGSSDASKQSGATQFSMKVPNDKVGLLIGKGGETIKYMQNKTGARMQIIPLHLPPGDTSTERTVYINGSADQIEAAKELVNDVVSGKQIINPSAPTIYVQPGYAMQQQPHYPYPQPLQYGYGQPPPSSYYSNYSQQPAWDQANPSQTPQQSAAYVYYGQQPQIGSAPTHPSYSYSQTPAVSTNDQSYSHQQPSYGQNLSGQGPHVEQQQQYASTYGITSAAFHADGAISQDTQAASTYPPSSYSQQMANSQTYWNSSSYTGHPSAQTVYDQTVYSLGGYGQAAPYATQPLYGQAGYSVHQATAPSNDTQGTQPDAYGQQTLETQTQSQPLNIGVPQSSAYGAEPHDGNSNATVQEVVPSQS